ncbi:glycosyltransferase family 2 protein [Tropicibacter sp. S64]|uniref:glycosyltransferase family 2 protein n=1 Tax=Tropicibacter sp. S64 TaxID=3415122 RepID=UPI003C7D5D94
MPDLPTWGTVSTVLEPPQALLAFAAHHLHAGAGELHLYLDRPLPQFQHWVAGKPGVFVTVCDDRYWREEHGRDRPFDSRYRQVYNANHAYRRARVDWLAHVDGDEYIIRVPQILRFIASQPDHVEAISLHNAEFVQRRGRQPNRILDGYFRKPFHAPNGPRQQRVYGDGAPFLLRGFSGYAIGKTLFRTGRDLFVDIHQPAPLEQWYTPKNKRRQWFPRIGLLHVDGFTRAHWEAKMAGRIAKIVEGELQGYNPARKRQVEAVLGLGDGGPDLHWLHDATRTLTPWQMLLMVRYRKLLPMRLNVLPALRAEFPDARPDLSPEAVDREIAALQFAA